MPAQKTPTYRPRLVEQIIKQRLRISGAVLIEGPKWCGKTTTARQFAKSTLDLGNPDELGRAKMYAVGSVSALLEGATPRLVDEWQTIPRLWDAARFAIDSRGKFGQFIFTGSAVPADTDEIIHTGTGRFSWVRMRPMSLYESGDSSGTISLAQLFSGKKILGDNPLTIPDLAYLTCRGGFPASINSGKNDALLVPYDYISAVIHADLHRLDGVLRSPEYITALLRSYARFQGSQAALTEIRTDIGSVTGTGPSIDTVTSYHDALKKIFVIEDLPAWNPNLRSKAAIRTTETRYYVDPSLAAAALGAGPSDLLSDLRTFGFLFETLCVRDLRIYAEALGGSISHYRDSNGLECDVVIHLRDGRYGLVQIKLGGTTEELESATKSLTTFAELINTKALGAPAFRMILTGATPVAHRRPDGVYVVPIGCLRP